MKKIIIYGLLVTLLLAGFYFGFLRLHLSNKNTPVNTTKKPLTLVDDSTKTKFTLDTAQIIITATDSSGKIVWTSDPWKDSNLKPYRVARPVIVYFELGYDKYTVNKEVIQIGYDNSQFGIVDKTTGKFTFYGQD